MSEKVAILDAGAQYGKVIDRRVRELAVESVLLPLDTPASHLREYAALIISGGPESVYGEKAPKYDPALFSLKVPILGICYGMQLMNYVAGGTVEKKQTREDGPFTILVNTNSALFKGFEPQQEVLLTHGDTVATVAPGFKVIGMSGPLVAAIENRDKQWFGVQFHPEVDLTVQGKELLRHFLYHIVGLTGSFTMESREETAVKYIQKKVGSNDVLVLLSGGVDSTVLAVLLQKALPSKQLHAIHIDNGLMRQAESKQVVAALRKAGVKVKLVAAAADFLKATTLIDGVHTRPLSEETDPEHKRKICGDTFVAVAQKAISELKLSPDRTLLAQGTLRPDLIESASKTVSTVADTIKTHHNDTFLVRKLRNEGKVIEPLSEYHKDEVRELGSLLGLPEELVWRQPFPGPGLAIRILCADSPYHTPDFDELQKTLAGFGKSLYATALLPIRTVGVQGDGRTYSYAAAVSGPTKWPELLRLAREIPKVIHKVNRVVYVFGEKLASRQVSITPTRVNPECLAQLRQADQIVNELLLQHKLTTAISQVPVVLLPLSFDEVGKRSVVIRTFITNDFMTGVPALPGREMPVAVLNEMVNRILREVPGISRVLYDLTSKPPGTTEWE